MTTKLNYSWMCQPLTYGHSEAEIRVCALLKCLHRFNILKLK